MAEEITRSEHGHFVAGVSPNPKGFPRTKREAIQRAQQRLELIVRQKLNPERISRILEKLTSMAEEGDKQAADLILKYAVAKPAQEQIKSDAPSGGKIVIHIENATLRPERAVITQDGTN